MKRKHGGNTWSTDDAHSQSKRQSEASGEDLSEYIHAGSPGIIVVIISMLVMLAAVILWGITGTLPVTETVTGLVVDTSVYNGAIPEGFETPTGFETPIDFENDNILIYCFVDASRFNGQAIKEFGNKAVLKMPDQSTCTGEIVMNIHTPVSMEKAKEILFDNEWVLERCVKQNYNWMLIIRPSQDMSQYAFTLAEVTLLTEEVPPIRFLMK